MIFTASDKRWSALALHELEGTHGAAIKARIEEEYKSHPNVIGATFLGAIGRNDEYMTVVLKKDDIVVVLGKHYMEVSPDIMVLVKEHFNMKLHHCSDKEEILHVLGLVHGIIDVMEHC